MKAVLFDLDDTLFDRGAAFDHYVADLMQRHPRAFPDERREADGAMLAALDARGLEARWVVFARMAEAFPALRMTAAAIGEDFRARIGSYVRADPRVVSAVEAIGARYRVAIVSNGGALTQREKIARLGLGRRVGAVFISEEVGAEKPDPRIFRRALAWTECAADEVLFVGDDPERDIEGAAARPASETTYRCSATAL